MTLSVTTAYADNASTAAQRALSRVTARDNGGTAGRAAGDKATSVVADIVTLSPTAEAVLAAKPKIFANQYEQYFPVRDGYSAAALAAAIDDPGVETFSAGKTIGQVADAARAAMDDKYAAMRSSGEPFDYDSWEGRDWYSLMGDLDRRALYAVSNNQDGLFTKREQDIAQSIMIGQQGWAMGLPNGPTRLVEGLPQRVEADQAAGFKAAIDWLDRVSNDEKTSISWAMSRAAVETSYGWVMEERGETPEDVDSGNPLARLIKQAMDTMKDSYARSITHGSVRNADDLKDQPWFAGFEDRLDAAIQQTRDLYRTDS